MISKKDQVLKCPFNKMKPCDNGCAFFRKGVRFNEVTKENYPFEACAINLIADNLEAMHSRTAMVQKEVGDAKNIIAIKTAVDLGLAKPEHKETLSRMLRPPDESKLLT